MKKIIFIIATILLFTNFGYCQKDCEPISSFPWKEGFENNGTGIPPCWDVTYSSWNPTWKWAVVPDSIGTPATAHTGNYKARTYGLVLTMPYESSFITPIFDLSAIETPILKFWHTQVGSGLLSVRYRNSSNENWELLQSFSDSFLNWQEEIIELPKKSNHYQILFHSYYYGGGNYQVQLDDISIFDANPTVSYRVNISTNSGTPPTGAIVTLMNQDGQPEHIYTEISDSTGATIQNVLLGKYDIEITLAGHNDYTVTGLIINESGLEYTAQLIKIMLIEENSMKFFSLFPNPAQDLITITRSEATKISVAIYNSIGALVHSFETLETEFVVNVSNYNTGVYFTHLSDGSKSATKSFVKQ